VALTKTKNKILSVIGSISNFQEMFEVQSIKLKLRAIASKNLLSHLGGIKKPGRGKLKF